MAATAEEGDNSILYGTIGALDNRPQNIAQCWLVDPPAGVVGDPRRYKLLARFEYVARHIAWLGQRSQLAAALNTRLAALHAAKDYNALDRVALRTGGNEGFAAETYDQTGTHNQWFASKSVVSDGPAGGQVFVANTQVLLFVGIREHLVAMAASQSFGEIIDYSFPAGIAEKTVECVVSKARFEREFSQYVTLPDRVRKVSGGYFRFALAGKLHYSQSGLVFGVLPIPEAWRTAR